MASYVRVIEHNAFERRPLVYYVPMDRLSEEELRVLLEADHRVFDAYRYEGDGMARDYDEPVSRAMRLVRSKSAFIVDGPKGPHECAHSVLFVYANMEEPWART